MRARFVRVQRPERMLMVRVVRDSRDSRKDYYLPIDRARALYEERKLIQVQIYGGSWDYATRNPSETVR